MNKFFYAAVFSISIAACSSSPKVEPNVKTIEPNRTANNTIANNAAQAAVNLPNINAPTSAPNGNVTIQNFLIRRETVENMRKKPGARAGESSPMPNAVLGTTAAPDNSEIMNTMNAKGLPLDRRTFKNHPVLVKIERTDLNDRDIKVYLKNGKVVTLPESMANDFLKASASDILKAIGQ